MLRRPRERTGGGTRSERGTVPSALVKPQHCITSSLWAARACGCTVLYHTILLSSFGFALLVTTVSQSAAPVVRPNRLGCPNTSIAPFLSPPGLQRGRININGPLLPGIQRIVGAGPWLMLRATSPYVSGFQPSQSKTRSTLACLGLPYAASYPGRRVEAREE